MAVTKIYGTAFNDDLVSYGLGESIVYGLEGDDQLTSYDSFGLDRSFRHTLSGGAGNDIIAGSKYCLMVNGNEGEDDITSQFVSDSKVLGGQGNDNMIVFADGDASNARVNGNMGNDVISYIPEPSPLVLAFEDTVDSWSITNSTIFGGQGNDEITIESHLAYGDRTVFDGNQGNDKIYMLFAPQSPITSLIGGQGVDLLFLSDALPFSVSRDGETVTLKYSEWQIDGLGYVQQVNAVGFEQIYVGDVQLKI